MKIVTSSQMRQAEEECARAGLPGSALMENAGRAVAEAVRRILGDAGSDVVVLVGPGNNGGDGLVAARYLHDFGANVTVYLVGQRSVDDPNLALVNGRGVPVVRAADDAEYARLERLLASAGVVMDTLLGTGRSRPLSGVFSGTLGKVAEARRRRPAIRVIAVDMPSGLDADTGNADPACLRADDTITLGFPKVGLFISSGADMSGRLEVADIGIPAHHVEASRFDLMTTDVVRGWLPFRSPAANKGTFGRTMVVAGSRNYTGAAYLACSGAMRVGAGLVTLAAGGSLHAVLASKLTEATHLPLPESDGDLIASDAAVIVRRELNGYQVLLIGCGLGQKQSTSRLVKSILFQKDRPPFRSVIDADALNVLSRVPQWWRRLPDDAILTPHPGEMARLTGMTVESIQSDRLSVARNAAQEWHKTVVLKGAYTVIAAPDGRATVSPFANPGMASAGTGDVLAGAAAGFASQGMTLFEAAACGVYVHGKAGQMVRDELGDAGMIAGDLLPVLPRAIRSLKKV